MRRTAAWKCGVRPAIDRNATLVNHCDFPRHSVCLCSVCAGIVCVLERARAHFSVFVCMHMQLIFEYINSKKRYTEAVCVCVCVRGCLWSHSLPHHIVIVDLLCARAGGNISARCSLVTTIHLGTPRMPGSKSAPLSRIIYSIISSQFMCQLCVI